MRFRINELCLKVVRPVVRPEGDYYTSIYTKGVARFKYKINQEIVAPSKHPMFVYRLPQNLFTSYGSAKSVGSVCNEYNSEREILLCSHAGFLPTPKHIDVSFFEYRDFLSWEEFNLFGESKWQESRQAEAAGVTCLTPLMQIPTQYEEKMFEFLTKCKDFIY